ncbi:tRNA uridine-5-carboxymethylaminomethyl(34) synthesis GTPase MnmE [Anaerosporobacter faecicola]|uniref:tRNA uridine-5-carboxymethylaminomethyl(34) synthesis GTPase MnmE n=1 Tax=Anaerosporobacter faecicola TaxID=2718714 RepID=UPI001A9BB30C
MKTDTIAAISTGMTNAGISIVRISGDEAFNIIDKIYSSPKGDKKLSEVPSHTVHYGYILDGDRTIDEVMVLVLRGPNTYTREDVIEIDCHGGVVVTKKILETVVKYGARVAEPGEFTKRAFVNGRIDLSQAEAVIDVINAKNEYALSSSLSQLKGNVLGKIKEIRDSIIHNVAFIEAALDDPEHIEIGNFSEELLMNVNSNLTVLDKLLESADNGRLLREGIKTVILGKPNAGKSSLMNVLLGEDRAIVTDIAGTTRDTLEETVSIHGITLNIVDTAGIRDTADVIEKIGVKKARENAMNADLIIYVVDGSRDFDENDYEIMELIKERKCVVLLNKSDLNMKITIEQLEELTHKTVIKISAKEGTGIEEFETCIKELFYEGKLNFNDEIYITNVRHKAAIAEAKESLLQVKNSILDGMSEDFFSIDLMSAYNTLGYIIGEMVDDDLVNTIFKEFCMGK